MSNEKIQVSVDLGYGYVKAISSLGNRVIFPSLVGNGYKRGITSILGNQENDLKNMQVLFNDEDFFVGELANESRSLSRIFERERFNHMYTKVLLNVAIQLVSNGGNSPILLSTGLPLDFYQAQAKEFKESISGVQPMTRWKSGTLKGHEGRVVVENAAVFPQGASAIFSALINHEGKYTYPHYMTAGALIGLIDVGFRTTDFVVVEIQENGSFIPKAKLSGTIDDGVINLHRDVRQAYKIKTGGADLNEYFLNRVLRDGSLMYKGSRMDFREVIEGSKSSISTNIVDRLKNVWGEESDLFDGIFLAGGGGELFEEYIQPNFDNRLEKINESQFANAIGYLRLGKMVFGQ